MCIWPPPEGGGSHVGGSGRCSVCPVWDGHSEATASSRKLGLSECPEERPFFFSFFKNLVCGQLKGCSVRDSGVGGSGE